MSKYGALDAAIIAAIKGRPGIAHETEAIAHETDSRESGRIAAKGE